LQFRFRFLDTSIENGSFEDFIKQIDYKYWDSAELSKIVNGTPWDFVQVFILKIVKVFCFDTLLQVFILKGLKLTCGARLWTGRSV
jgi:hypothetical protein